MFRETCNREPETKEIPMPRVSSKKSIYPGRLAVKGLGTRLLKAKRFVKEEERGGMEGKDALTTFQRTMKA